MIRFILKGKSMKPLFREGDILAVEKADPASLQKGNIILFNSPETSESVAHRIIDIQNSNKEVVFITRGDNSPSQMERVLPDWIVGRVSGKYKNNRVKNLSRLEEFFSWKYSTLYRGTRSLVYYLCRRLIPPLYPLLPIRVISLDSPAGGKRKLAVFFGKVVAEKNTTLKGDSLWVHPLFRGTKIVDEIG